MIPAVQERLQKVLARAGFASRRGAEALMQEGRVTVNGAVVRELGTKADPAHDDVRVDGVRVKAAGEPVYIVLNKPRGVVTTRRDPAGRPTVMDLVPGVAGLFPVGRLDLTTEGLILLTNDGAFAERVSHPRFEVPRVYHAKVRGVPDAPTLARLRRGVRVEGDIMMVDRVRLVEVDRHAWVEVTLHEGKQHEVKRLLEAVGHPVSKLRRVAFGPITLQRLAPGQYRNLEPAEVAGLLRGEGSPAELTRRPRRRRRAAARRKTGPGKAGAREATARKASVRKAGAGKAVSGKSDARRGSARKGNARGIGARKAGERTASGRTAGGRKAGGRTADSRARTRRPGTARSTRAPGRGGQSTVPPRGSRKRSGGAGRRGRR
jgi:pseudouridine synthase